MDWSSENQAYLMKLISMIRQQLEWFYQFHVKKNKKATPPDSAIVEKKLKEIAGKMDSPPAIEKLVQRLGLSAFERDILVLCAALELDPGFTDVLASVHNDGSLTQPSFSTALAVLKDAHWSAISPANPLRYWQLIEINNAPLITKSSLKINDHILYYLTGVQYLHPKLREIAEPIYTDGLLAPSQMQLAEEIIKLCTDKNESAQLPYIQFSGIDNADKASVASYVSTKLKLGLFGISAYDVPMNVTEAAELACLWNREAALNDYALFIDCSDIDSNDKNRTYALKSFIRALRGLVIINTHELTLNLKQPTVVFDIKKPSSTEQLSLWKEMSGANGNSEALQLNKLVSQFNLSADAIHKAATEIFSNDLKNQVHNEAYQDVIQKKLWKTCCNYTRPHLDELVERITPVASWDDIVLPDPQKNILRDIAVQVKQRSKVYGDWGFENKGLRGLGISALFAGESGTGKTMASEVLANELQLDLYKIDLSKVVNKYIGETEKNLKRIFDAADDGGAILLFDEADALFGKRSEVKDSHDRYSNIEVSYLLQRMESYRGLAILTTNMKNALDKAFMRRIRFVVQFPFPDAVQRAEIWKKIFPQNTPQKDLSTEKLALLNLPGGSIRNVALNAAFYAAHENSGISMQHITKAAKAEYDKLEKPLTSMEIKGWQ
ncbi:ATP-binding protein [Mucilaginibacter agri]|uniref:AAA family ATPase n=1 Tax=Mucilaginibacter agri TaxID=2695265 RepID=A0A965ZKM0_9SPHI|nr:AAA family ATPase [Mucilaginibacter agri]NCD71684.1 AAA family ATPase [Mucilaginibacter agri]